MKYQYRKHNVSKHERDRLDRLQWSLFVDKLISEAIAERDAWLQERSRVEQLNSLGNGCYWHISHKGAE